ncbi:SH3 domain-containing protein [Streptomyces lushanensis]|uniref:SH3 domain-containing protein n=1 Tax=Streptomyces lushanensis TaxID=1434255 RepID=UPI000835AF51|nr:SH3 domain-containing protein [Streptomyces lushanensis]
MPVRSSGRTAAVLTVTALAATTLATVSVAPALAAPPAASSAATGPVPVPVAADEPAGNPPSKPQTDDQGLGRYRGKVVARTGLLLRDKPTRSSRVVGELEYGDIVRIFCKVEGGDVEGNNRWYLLADGSWAWGSAKYIRSLGETPHWC